MARRRRPHPAKRTRRAAAGLSVAAFAGLTGYLALETTTPDPTPRSTPDHGSTSETGTPTSWGATPPTAPPTAHHPTTRSHGS